MRRFASRRIHAAFRIEANPDWRLLVIGLVSDGTWTDAGTTRFRVLGCLDDLPQLVVEHVVDEVIVAPTAGQPDQLRQIEPVFLALEERGVVLRILANFLPHSAADLRLEHLGGARYLIYSRVPPRTAAMTVRDAFDRAAAAVLLVLLSPLLLFIAVAIKATSPGPVLFRQTRCGLNGRRFTLYKFRSMQMDADTLKASLTPFNEMSGPAFKMTRDPRVTAVGALLRRSSLDELPQLWNIMQGDMSFVGPRPAVVEEVTRYQPWQRRRLSVKPGLTGLWQVSGRNELSFDDWIRLDLEYIDNWSMWLDLKIALKTIPAVLVGRGAR
jgi:exopolysaccharide biosynthesis polyprenyl glycosylphosphotransferase